MFIKKAKRTPSERAAEARQLALARITMAQAYNVSLWPWIGGIIAALFSVVFVVYAIAREREQILNPSAAPPPAPTEQLIWVE